MNDFTLFAESLESRLFLSATGPRGASGSPPAVEWMRFNYESEQSVTVQYSSDVTSTLSGLTLRVTDLDSNQVIAWCLFFPRIESGAGEPTLATWKYFGGTLADGNYVADVLSTTSTVQASENFFVLAGDANHDGTINFDDYVALDEGYNNHGSGYSHGDFNYDGVVDYDDYVIIDSTFNGQYP